MFNLKSIQKIITLLSVGVFALSFIMMIYFTFSNPNGFIADSLGAKPIDVLTNTKVLKFSYGDDIKIQEDSKIINEKTTIVSKSITANFKSNNILRVDGVAYLKIESGISVQLSNSISIVLSAGDYIVSSNPVKIYVLSGVATYEQIKIGAANQTATWQVDRFKTTELNTDDFTLSKSYSDLIILLRNIELLPSQLTNLSLDTSSVTSVQVSDSEELSPLCESDILYYQLVCGINKYRSQNNLNGLEIEEDLNQLTLSHSVWMNDNQSTSTIESNGLSYIERCNKSGLECIAEINLIVDENYSTDSLLTQILTNKNILNKDAKFVGITLTGNYLSLLLR